MPSNLDPHTTALLAHLMQGEPEFVENMAPGEGKTQAILVGNLVTHTVAFLRDLFPNPRINDLMRLVWDLIGHRAVPAVIGPVPSPAMGVAGGTGMVLLPANWPLMMTRDPLMQVGAMVFVGSQARDFYRGLIRTEADSETIRRRAHGYEAEYLKTLYTLNPALVLNNYQKGVVAEFPNGLPTDLAYDSGEFKMVRA